MTRQRPNVEKTARPHGRSQARAQSRPPRRDGDVTGVFRRAAGGYGFVRPEGALPGDRSGDIHISAAASLDAASGDTVRVRLARGRDVRRPGPAGEIVEVIERRTTRFVGSYFERAGVGWVQVDGTSFTRPVAVGDPGAKGVHVDDKVVVELIRFPTHLRDGEGVVVEVLGKAGDVGVDTQTVIHEFGLPGAFPEAALDDARRQAAKFDETVPAGRRDLSGRTIITIDPVDARDFDDAISLEKVERGHWLLGV
ncbi:MAG: RNB domain-containing ribonuclease, partial [Planctomycetota bacterium]